VTLAPKDHEHEGNLTMTKNAKKADSTQTPAELRAKADAVIEALRIATTTRDEAARALTATGKPKANQDHLRKCLAEQSFQIAEDDVLRLQVEASTALDLAELAEANEETIACDPQRLHADVTALLAAEDELRRELDAQRRKRVERVEQATKASDAVASRRSQQGIPLSPAMVRVRSGAVREMLGGLAPFEMRPLASEVSWRDGIARALTDLLTPKPPKPKRAEIAALREQEIEIRAAIERQHREEEARAARIAEFNRRKAEEQRDADARQRNETERLRAEYAAEQKAREELAAAHRRREAEGTA
jgi:hypothetical protein